MINRWLKLIKQPFDFDQGDSQTEQPIPNFRESRILFS